VFNHCDVIMKLCDDASLAVGVAQMGILKEQVMRLLATLTGHRFGRGMVTVGGVARALDGDGLVDQATRLAGSARRVFRLLLATESFLDRLQRTGRLTAADAGALGASGPVARGSGLAWDARAERPYGAYGLHPVRCVTVAAGDAMARFEVRLARNRGVT